MKLSGVKYKDVPLTIVGSTKFGRYPKMSSEQTYNMIISDGWLTPFAGYKNVVNINGSSEGRGIYSSSRAKRLIAVIDDKVYNFDSNLGYSTASGQLTTSKGDVFLAENNNGQIAISDGVHVYIYTIATNALVQATIDFLPGYLTFQDERFISPVTTSNEWRLSDLNQGFSWPFDSQHVGRLATKPDKTVAAIRFPGRGNLLMVFGSTVAEQWYDVGAQLFPYQRSQSTNVDYGCLNPATIAENENMVCWIAANEKSGPVISYTDGGEVKHISTDGIDFKLSTLTQPQNCYGFMFKQDGHLFYVATWPHDRVSYAYDFNTQAFFTLCDEQMNAFIAKRVAFFNDQYYFVSILDGNLYQLGTQFSTYDYGNGKVYEIPRIRITPSVQLPDQSRFIAGYSGFTIEQGQFDYDDRDTTFILATEDGDYIATENPNIILGGGENYRVDVPRVDMTISKDGGVNFGSASSKDMYPLGRRANRLMWWQIGASNDLVHQFRFWGFNRFVATDGITGIYQ